MLSSAAAEPAPPSIEKAQDRAAVKLPLTADGQPFRLTGNSETEVKLAFEELGLGVTGYMDLLKHWYRQAGLCLLLSVPSMVSNAYGHALDDMQTSFNSWLFTVTTLGNASTISPSYGATEFCISCIITASLFQTSRDLKIAEYRSEKHKVSCADFALEVVYDPSAFPSAAELKKCVEKVVSNEFRSLPGVRHIKHFSAPLHQRELKILSDKYDDLSKLMAERQKALKELSDYTSKGKVLSKPAEKRFKGLQAALDKDKEAKKKLAVQILKEYKKAPSQPPLCGLAYATMTKVEHVQTLLDKTLEDTVDEKTVKVTFRRPPEPTDVIWENLGCNDNGRRQLLLTFECTLLSLVGSGVIGFVTFMQQAVIADFDSATAKSIMNMIGTVAVIASYLLIFIFVPQAEEFQMRHKTITNREQSQVVKLVVFQVIATIATSTVFLVETGGAFTRDWYMTGGFLVINGMMVDLFVITVLVQGYQLIGVLIPQFAARTCSPPLTQYEADILMAPKSNMYVNDRLQMVTKFVCMTYIYASAMPLLWGILFLVCMVSQYLDTRNLLRVLQPPPQSGSAQVRVIVNHIMPVAAFLHLLFQFFMITELMDGIDRDWLADFNELLSKVNVGNLTSAASSVISGVGSTLSNVSAVVQSAEAGVNSVGNFFDGDNDEENEIMKTSFGKHASEDAMALIKWSILINAPIIFIYFANKWRKQLGFPSLADKLQVKQMEKLVASMGKDAAKMASDGVTALAKAAKAEGAAKSIAQSTTKTVSELAAAFQGLGQVVGDGSSDTKQVKNRAEEYSYDDFCTVISKPKLNPSDDPYKSPMNVERVDKIVKKVKEEFPDEAKAIGSGGPADLL